ncbi:hypothetical protein PgNI_10670 [Pyricularia grisea]|uniref:Uncharacterized protein n=1 Tax=Pyricularia grisea TaxID=148305 RepID=A0A6P8AXS4_PYRGI|nr:hypothetical protein PgNI_10670 [Pyricularia grisea]TLD07089.1 hypothetical protein PgNI_10670 [Pyricularia grisea]
MSRKWRGCTPPVSYLALPSTRQVVDLRSASTHQPSPAK